MSASSARVVNGMAKPARHRAILNLVRGGVIRTQEDLVAELHRRRFAVTQATVSRDIRELGLVRVHDDEGPRYMAPVAEIDAEQTMHRLRNAIEEHVLAMEFVDPARHRPHRPGMRAAGRRGTRRIAIRGSRGHHRGRRHGAGHHALATRGAAPAAPAHLDPRARSVSARERCVLAYSGGLDTSVAIRWLQEELGYDVVTLTADLGESKDVDAVAAPPLGARTCVAYPPVPSTVRTAT